MHTSAEYLEAFIDKAEANGQSREEVEKEFRAIKVDQLTFLPAAFSAEFVGSVTALIGVVGTIYQSSLSERDELGDESCTKFDKSCIESENDSRFINSKFAPATNFFVLNNENCFLNAMKSVISATSSNEIYMHKVAFTSTARMINLSILYFVLKLSCIAVLLWRAIQRLYYIYIAKDYLYFFFTLIYSHYVTFGISKR